MADAGRRGKFSLLFWPSLYSPRMIFGIAAGFAAAAGMTMLLFYIARQNDRQVLARASERVKTIMALKLSGADRWLWKRELTCESQKADCLRVEFSFEKPASPRIYVEKLFVPRPCRICHENTSENDLSFYAAFPEIAVSPSGRLVEWLCVGVIGALGIFAVVYLVLLGRRRRSRGICVAAFEYDVAAPKAVRDFIARLAGSRFKSYYGDAMGYRARIATTPGRLAKILKTRSDFLEKNRGSLRFIAVHVDLKQNSILPIETLRSVLQFLARTPARTYLIHERLAELMASDGGLLENGRRLVFKNKSGASVKFVPWQAENDSAHTAGAE
ncbi:MAG: hypothetical protein J0L53_17630 [Spirochaetes bacterium]|nr:hypothetical protein [Spirochaetota bacterium]